jgi:hypothetical protein
MGLMSFCSELFIDAHFVLSFSLGVKDSSRMMGFGFLGLAEVQRVAMNLLLAPAKSGSHVEHEPAFFKTQWPTTALQ